MNLFRWQKNKLKMGKITILKVRHSHGIFIYSVCNIPVWISRTRLSILIEDVKNNKKFDMREFDRRVEYFIQQMNLQKILTNQHRIAILATELYDMGGHTKCLRDLAGFLSSSYSETLFLTQGDTSGQSAPKAMEDIAKHAAISINNIRHIRWKKDITELFYRMYTFNPKVVFVFIHPDDVYGCLLLAMMKKYTNIKIFYCPHASHYPNMGLSFADLSLEGMPVTAYITQKFRKFKKTHIIGMASKRLDDFPAFTPESVMAKRRELGIYEHELCTMSGGSSYKFFDTAGSEYFLMIKKLLKRNPQVKHIVLSDFNTNQRKIISSIFSDFRDSDRLILLPVTSQYELVFSCADVFIDSFPVSSALTMIDLMRLKVPAVVKINQQNALWSFHEYQRNGYPYMFETVEGVLEGTEKLLGSAEERKRVAESNYQYYLEKYEGNACKKHLVELIEHADELETYYDAPVPDGNYQFGGMTL